MNLKRIAFEAGVWLTLPQFIIKVMPKQKPFIRLLETKDISEIVKAFQQLGWNKPAWQYELYLKEQALKIRDAQISSTGNRHSADGQS